jgi:SpoVK/Ycf46/Vps4 family AAA+-type ATPase
VVQRLLRVIAQGYNQTARTLVFISPSVEMPGDLARMSARFRLSVLDAAGVRELIREEAKLYESRNEKPRGTREVVDLLAQHLSGMCRDDARRLIRQAIEDDGAVDQKDVARILRLKHEALGKGGVLSFELDVAKYQDVGGLQNLKRWLDRRKPIFLGEGQTQGLDTPKGILLLGVQGGGKSLAAKAVAGSWGVPLLCLDFATLYNKFYGETEKNLRESLLAAESMAPCVLWVDEIEKGLASDASGATDGGVSRRILGTLLTWMSERKSRVFLVATSNDISHLPPELLRKGRFDEIFFVDLPDAATREEIFRIHLARRKHNPASFDLKRLSLASDGFSGAEIEQAIVSALYEALARKAAPSTELIEEELRNTKPLSVTMAEQVAELRAWAAERTVLAN